MGICRRGARRRGTPPRLDPRMKYPDYINSGQAVGNPPAGETDFFAEVQDPASEPPAPPKKPPQKIGVLTLTRGAAFLCAVGLVFLIVWVFVLGILVGRGAIFQNEAFRKMQEKLLDNKVNEFAQALEVTEENPPAKARPVPVKTELTFFEDLTKSKTAPEEKAGRPPNPPPKTIPPKKESPAKPEPPAVPLKLQDPGASAKSAAKAKDATAPERNPGEKFTVQVAAARTLDEAGMMIDRLKKQGFEAYYYKYVSNNTTYYRIRVGRLKSRAEAQAMLERLTEKGSKNMFLSTLVD